jgi:hypothetical protein
MNARGKVEYVNNCGKGQPNQIMQLGMACQFAALMM